MKIKLLVLIGICVFLFGCGAKQFASLKSGSSVTEQEIGVLHEDVTETVEATEVVETTEEPDPEGTVRTTAENLKKLPIEIQKIFFGGGKFYDTGEKKEFTWKSYQVTDPYDGISDFVRGEEFLVSDVDRDGEQELLVYLLPCNSERGSIINAVRIFDFSKGTVYTHPHRFRDVKDVYENGIMGGSSGASNYNCYRISYDGEKETKTMLACTEMINKAPGTAYYIGDEKKSEEEYYNYIRQIFDEQDGHDGASQILWSREHLSDIIE